MSCDSECGIIAIEILQGPPGMRGLTGATGATGATGPAGGIQGTINSFFTANGSRTIFGPLAGASSTVASNYFVTVGGVSQEPDWSYTILEEDGIYSVEFPEAIRSGIRISVRTVIV
jgi:hypothetical protein